MPCAKPLTAYLTVDGVVSFSAQTDNAKSFPVPCGKCPLCIRGRKSELMARLVMEGWSHAESICATLTYSDEHLPPGGGLSKRDIQLWCKRVRIHYWRTAKLRLRFHVVGEYSPEKLRPHYHVIAFGLWPSDTVPAGKSRSGRPQFESKVLADLWGKGWVNFQRFDAGAAGYVAKHQASKMRRKGTAELARRKPDGTWYWLPPEFELRPLRPGLGGPFFEKHYAQLLAHGYVVIDGRKQYFGRYFNTLCERADPERAADMREQREAAALDPVQLANNTPERLAVRSEVAQARERFFSRKGGMDG